MSLTQSGTQFLEHAKAAIETPEAGVRGISERAAQRSGVVTVASVPSITHQWLPTVLKSFSEAFPQVRIRMIDGSANWVLSRVMEGAADLGLCFTGAQESTVDFRALHTERYVVAVRRDHRLARMKTVAWAALANESLITLTEESGNRVLIEHALARMKRRPQAACEANHVSGALGMVAAGLGVSIVPSLAMSQDMYPTLIGIALSAPHIDRTVGLISRKGASFSSAVANLHEALRKAPWSDALGKQKSPRPAKSA